MLFRDAPSEIAIDKRINISSILSDFYGDQYADDPKMPSLMKMNGEEPQGWLSGANEADAFKTKDYIRMHASTLAKVNFFHHVLKKAISGKLKTNGRSFGARIDTLLESRAARIVAILSSAVGIPSALGWIYKVLF